MNQDIFEKGIFNISNQTICLFGTIVNLSSINHLETITLDRHSYFAGIKDWFGGLILIFIISLI